MSDPNRDTRYFRSLQQPAFMKLEQAASLKGLLKPFKGKGDLEAWASQCFAMRDELIGLAQRQVLQQALGHPFHLLPIELAQQTTGAGTAFLRWRKHDRSAMGVALLLAFFDHAVDGCQYVVDGVSDVLTQAV